MKKGNFLKKKNGQINAWNVGIVINSIFILILMGLQGWTQYSLVQIEKINSPIEKIIPTISGGDTHENISEEYKAEISFRYSGKRTASYFIEWFAVNKEGTTDNIAPIKTENEDAVSTIKESDNRIYEFKNFKFLEKGTYTITATVYYYTRKPIGDTNELVRDYIKTNGESEPISSVVVVGKDD